MMRSIPRKPIAISISEADVYMHKVCVCNDGSIWQLNEGSDVWKRLPDIPQNSEEK